MGWDCRSDYGIERADNSLHSMYADNIIPEGSLYVYFTAEVVRHPLLPSHAYEFIETLGRVTDGDGEDIGSISPCGTFYYHEPNKDDNQRLFYSRRSKSVMYCLS